MWGELIGAAGSILGGIFGSNSAKDQNREEREWQERMAGTQYQRAVSDMRSAGLNPAMLYGKGPMAAPVSGGARQNEGEALARGVSGAALAASQMALTKAQIADVHSAASLKEAQKESVNLDNEIKFNTFAGKAGDDPYGHLGVNWRGVGELERRQAEQQIAESLARSKNLDASEAESRARAAIVGVEKRMLEYKESFAVAWKKYWDMVGVGGAFVEVGSRTFREVAGSLGFGKLFGGLINPGQKMEGPNSARSYRKQADVSESIR